MAILQEGVAPFKWVPNYGIHMPVSKLIRHQRTYRCKHAMYMRLRRWDVELDHRAINMKFSMYDQ